MKARILVLSAAAVFLLATSALAWGGRGRADFGGGCPMFSGPSMDGCSMMGGPMGEREVMRGQGGPMCGQGFRGRGMAGREVPAEIRAKMTEMMRTRYEMKLALLDEKPDRGKITALFEKGLALRNELAKWRFEQRMNSLSEKKQI